MTEMVKLPQKKVERAILNIFKKEQENMSMSKKMEDKKTEI